jgi:hypothetical protein
MNSVYTKFWTPSAGNFTGNSEILKTQNRINIGFQGFVREKYRQIAIPRIPTQSPVSLGKYSPANKKFSSG